MKDNKEMAVWGWVNSDGTPRVGSTVVPVGIDYNTTNTNEPSVQVIQFDESDSDVRVFTLTIKSMQSVAHPDCIDCYTGGTRFSIEAYSNNSTTPLFSKTQSGKLLNSSYSETIELHDSGELKFLVKTPSWSSITFSLVENKIARQRGPVTITEDGEATFNGITKVTFDGKTIDQLLTEHLKSMKAKNEQLLNEVKAFKRSPAGMMYASLVQSGYNPNDLDIDSFIKVYQYTSDKFSL